MKTALGGHALDVLPAIADSSGIGELSNSRVQIDRDGKSNSVSEKCELGKTKKTTVGVLKRRGCWRNDEETAALGGGVLNVGRDHGSWNW